jgi:hypothetical protein
MGFLFYAARRPLGFGSTERRVKMFMKKLTPDRVVPIISAKVSWLILGITSSGLPAFPKFAGIRSTRANLFRLS